ncbi:hypothetical protein M8997_001235 [Phyllobacterium sp. 21LDTY02-6]|uniref:hypothetical protein n=1 Tax=unclassified Phyllobacterium TaxID=2638441 RepID=UPI00202296E6|nr:MULTISPECIES: hypothetical protein [unclassified Phyllobacterium]MCO4315791.1 hypothetical protein [Phyllobacterium sp. 21LDTY02-6]MCX8282350.1 hypothetical protein [Phyllobacterium sp. 0TCS1.6C]MCX8292024.1 hypothetical protein [Phyllobacterium sp. 0TCS1.6A]
MYLSLDFQPLVSNVLLAAILLPLLALTLAGLYFRQRGSLIRLLAVAAFAIALVNPIVINEEREPLRSVVALVADRSQSQELGDRRTDTDAALAEVKAALARLPQFEVRTVETGNQDDDAMSTRLFAALNGAFRDVPPARIGGAIMITDGQVHDIPPNLAGLGFNAPLHGLITGRPGELDRRVQFIRAPRFGLTGKPQEMTYKVTGAGEPAGGRAQVSVRVNGNEVNREEAIIGEEMPLQVTLPRAGVNIVELIVEAIPGELTEVNNRAVAMVDGIRENLRVLLVSGEPHNGERTWRDLLKSDASVDLVHFTILRPPEKQDDTPLPELALIQFPVRELFVEKIDQFDLIIFDRYQHRDVLPLLYYDYINDYVQKGGALLIAAGPEYASNMSIANTPLLSVLPAVPTGNIEEKAFYPRLSDLGKRHPVTRGLEGSTQEPPAWSRWFRVIDVNRPEGQVVMDAGDKPLLVLNRLGEGRVGMFLSDQGWLWARGFEGGGPHAALYRRIAHWLMKEPELEEEALTAKGSGRNLEIRRQTMAKTAEPARVITPTGENRSIPLTETEPGVFTASVAMKDIGLYQIASGDLTTLAHVGPVDAPEFADNVSTGAKLDPLAQQSGGGTRRLRDAADRQAIEIPSIIASRGAGSASGDNWIGLRPTNETVLKSVDRLPLFSGFLGLAAMILVLGGMWYREGR